MSLAVTHVSLTCYFECFSYKAPFRSNLSSSPTDVRNNAAVIGSVTRPLVVDSGRYKLVTIPNALCVGR